MDRFIEQTHNSNLNRFNYLKSNMDRFIVSPNCHNRLNYD